MTDEQLSNLSCPVYFFFFFKCSPEAAIFLFHLTHEDIVVKDDTVLELCVCGRARYALAHIPKRRCHQGVPSVLQRRLLRHEELVGVLRSAVGMYEEGHHRGTHSSTG